MNLEVNVERLLLAQKSVRAELLAECAPVGCWEGQVSSSPAATAAAISALVISHHKEAEDVLKQSAANGGVVIEELVQCDLSELFVESLHWLARRQNEDGGWGDCDGARSNIAATMLVQAAYRLTGIPAKYADLMVRADDFVERQEGVAGLRRQYADNKAYLTSVLASCAAADMFSWRQVPTLPFEWLHLPERWRRDFSLPVARHLTPVVMAAGLAKLHNCPSRNPIARLARRSLRNKTLARLAAMQAGDDSYLASPLMTAFIVMSLASADCQEHPVVRRGIEFLLSSVRADASWSMTVNVSTRNTLLAIESLVGTKGHEGSHDQLSLSIWHDTSVQNDTLVDGAQHDGVAHDAEDVLARGIEWILKTQRNTVSVVTDCPAGGWASSCAAGAEPTTPATAGAVWLLSQVFARDGSAKSERIERSAGAGIRWLLEMQNNDGGWGTYSHNDDAEPGVASGVDATAGALRALGAWQRHWKVDSPRYAQAALRSVIEQIAPAIMQGLTFLAAKQNDDGSFVPLLFGNEHQANSENPVLGTAQVLAALSELGLLDSNTAERAASWMLAAQHTSGGWGPPRAPIDYSGSDRDVKSRSWRDNDTMAQYCSIEETAAAISALIPLTAKTPGFERAVSRGLNWLANEVEQDRHRGPAIIGFYLPQIWYYERLYPLLFAAGALSQSVGKLLGATPTVTSVS